MKMFNRARQALTALSQPSPASSEPAAHESRRRLRDVLVAADNFPDELWDWFHTTDKLTSFDDEGTARGWIDSLSDVEVARWLKALTDGSQS